jgi:cell division GTPase FtsZ
MLSLVGVGGAGCNILEAFYRKDLVSSIISKIGGEGYVRGVAIDTSETITKLNAIPTQNRVLIGSSRAKGHGTGGSVELGKKIMREESELAMNAIRRANIEKPEMFFVIAGLGGGTGTGGLPLLVERIKVTYHVPIIGILILPSRSEGTLYMRNAFKNFDIIKDALDGTIVVDNNVLTTRGEDISTCYKIVNEAVFNFLSVVDPIYILRTTEGKVSTIGFMRAKAERTSFKDILDKMLRDYLYYSIEGKEIEKMYLILYGDLSGVYGQRFAQNWVKENFGVEIDMTLKDDPSSKYLNTGLIITGLKDVAKGFEIKEEVKKQPSELEELLGDIKPLF